VILAVDAGNSRTKWGLFDAAGTLLRHGAVDNHDIARLEQDWRDVPGELRVVVSNVAGAAVATRLQAVCDRLAWPLRWIVASSAAGGVRNGYAQPQQLGTDRWAALVAAWNEYRAPCVVASAGTALTVDALSGDGEFIGGLIVPGLSLMRAALGSGTAGVGEAAGHWREFPISTADAVHSGALAAMGGAVRHMKAMLAAREGRASLCLLAGGDAEALADILDFPVLPAPHLVLRGLFLIESATP
jgi:type III pantothenate kinase